MMSFLPSSMRGGARLAGQPRCGDCRHFREAGFAGTGWCLHKGRQKAVDVRILVRRRELACMNDWGGSLFEPIGPKGPSPTPLPIRSDPTGVDVPIGRILPIAPPVSLPDPHPTGGDYLIEEYTHGST